MGGRAHPRLLGLAAWAGLTVLALALGVRDIRSLDHWWQAPADGLATPMHRAYPAPP